MMDEFDFEWRGEAEARKHEDLSRLHGRIASLLRERDSLAEDDRFVRSQWDAAMRVLDALGSRIEDVDAGELPKHARVVTAEWAADNLGAIRALLRVWRDDIEKPF